MKPMKRWSLFFALLLGLFNISCIAHASQVTLTMPDAQLKEAIDEVCIWNHCESEDNGGYKTDAEKAQWDANLLIRTISMGHYNGLQSLDATLKVRYDQDP